MDQSLIYLLMGLGGLFVGVIPFAVFMGLATQLGISDPSSTILITSMFLLVICIGYLGSLGAFSAIQNQACGKIKNMKQIAGNAGISTLIMTAMLTLVVFIPYLRDIVVKLFPPTMDPLATQAVGFSYFLFWAGLYGFGSGGFMSSNCGDPAPSS